MAAPTTTAGLTAFIPNYWDRLLGDNLRPNLYFYDLGEKRKLPSNFGTTIKIPRIRKGGQIADIVYSANNPPNAAESAVTGPCALSSEFASGTLKKFRGAYKHGDIVIMTALSDVIQLSLEDLAYDLTLKMDTHIRDQISATGRAMVPLSAGGATEGTLTATKGTAVGIFKPAMLVRAVTRLKSQNNPVFPGTRCYAGMFNPLITYDIQTQTSTTFAGWIDINKYQNGEKIFNGEVGKLFGVKIIESTNVKASYGNPGSLLSAGSALSFSKNYILAPRSYYVTELDAMAAHTFVKQLGSSGTADPTNEVATVGAKVFFTAIPATWSVNTSEYRMIRLITKRTL